MAMLLVSVRNAEEAKATLAGGADIIDVKEPTHGSLGAADVDVISSIVKTVRGRVPVSVALGELAEFDTTFATTLPPSVSFAKWGLANWQRIEDGRGVFRQAQSTLPTATGPVAVIYADWQAAGSPQPAAIVEMAYDTGCPVVLFDTFDKSAGRLFDHVTEQDLVIWIGRIHDHGMLAALAGSLRAEDIARVHNLAVDIVAVRGAACVKGRTSSIDAKRVRRLKSALDAATVSLAAHTNASSCEDR